MATTVQEVARDVWRIEASLGERFIASYVLAGTHAIAIVDTGLDVSARSALLPAVSSLLAGRELPIFVVSTHCDFDHTGGNAAFQERYPSAVFMCGEEDRSQAESLDLLIEQRYGEFHEHGNEETAESKRYIRENAKLADIHIGLRGGEIVRLSAGWTVKVIHTPGHSLGSISVWDPRSRALIIGDAVLGRSVLTADGRPAFPPTYRYVDSYLSTIEAVRSLHARLLLTSHYPIKTDGEVEEFLDESLEFVHSLEERIIAELREGDLPLLLLASRIAPSFGPWSGSANDYLVNPIYGHLERLVTSGSLTKSVGQGATVWRLAGKRGLAG